VSVNKEKKLHAVVWVYTNFILLDNRLMKMVMASTADGMRKKQDTEEDSRMISKTRPTLTFSKQFIWRWKERSLSKKDDYHSWTRQSTGLSDAIMMTMILVLITMTITRTSKVTIKYFLALLAFQPAVAALTRSAKHSKLVLNQLYGA
jgi:hypothetical protein